MIVFQSGKYKGLRVDEIYGRDNDYLRWFYSNANPANCPNYNEIVNLIAELLNDPAYPKKLRIVSKPDKWRGERPVPKWKAKKYRY